MTILVTGVAGFIAARCARMLLDAGESVLGVDNLGSYYDPELKKARLASLQGRPGFEFRLLDVADQAALSDLARGSKPRVVLHLAAQPGVRRSLDAPFDCARDNLSGFVSALEAARAAGASHFVHASSSSVYGASPGLPWREDAHADAPLSLYAASKRSGEIMASSYASSHGLPCTGLRLFTVYGPWGRPDMAPWKFALRVARRLPVELYGQGRLTRDFTHVDDVASAFLAVAGLPPRDAAGGALARVLNVGTGSPRSALELLETIEAALGKRSERALLPEQPGDAPATWADASAIGALCGWEARVGFDRGVADFARWFEREGGRFQA